jgi:spore germination protein GerM
MAHRVRSRWTAFLAVAVLSAGCSGSATPPTTQSPTTSSTPTTTPTLSTTSTTSTTTTSTATTTTTAPSAGPYHAIVYMLHDSGGSPTRAGPFLAPVSRNEGSLEGTLREWLGGLTPSEADLGITTEVPPGTALQGVEVADGVATVNLSSEFAAGGESIFSMRARLAQLVYTVTGYDPDITGVRLELDGTPAIAFGFSGGEALVLHDPMTRERFEDLLPGILIESPAFDAWARPPVTISGIAATPEGTFQLEILHWDGSLVTAVTVQTDPGTGWRPFSVTFDRSDLPSMPTTLQIRVYELSAEDGSVIYERVQPFGYRSNP